MKLNNIYMIYKIFIFTLVFILYLNNTLYFVHRDARATHSSYNNKEQAKTCIIAQQDIGFSKKARKSVKFNLENYDGNQNHSC